MKERKLTERDTEHKTQGTNKQGTKLITIKLRDLIRINSELTSLTEIIIHNSHQNTSKLKTLGQMTRNHDTILILNEHVLCTK